MKSKIIGSMNSKNIIDLIAILILAHLCSCKYDKNEPLKQPLTVYKDSIFDQKFQMSGPGFTGGDATYSVLLPDGRTVWIFGDTFIGKVTPELTREKTSPMYIRNCFVVQDGEEMKTLHQGRNKDFISMAVPQEVQNKDKTELETWFWPGDGFVYNNKLMVFMSKFHQAEEGMWGFEFLESVLVEYSLPNLKEVNRINIPYAKESGIHFGHAIYEANNYLYIYGLKDQKPYVARSNYKNLTKDWEFFDGAEWVQNIKSIAPILEVSGSEQFSIIQLKNKYVMITQLGSLSKKVSSYISETPYGPWYNLQILFETPIDYKNEELFTYNALAHPQFTTNDELLISYNTNSMKLEDHFTNAGIYRPRFMRVPISFIFKE